MGEGGAQRETWRHQGRRRPDGPASGPPLDGSGRLGGVPTRPVRAPRTPLTAGGRPRRGFGRQDGVATSSAIDPSPLSGLALRQQVPHRAHQGPGHVEVAANWHGPAKSLRAIMAPPGRGGRVARG